MNRPPLPVLATAAALLLALGACTANDPPAPPTPSVSTPPSAITTPTEGDFQTGRPDPGEATTAPPRPSAPPMSSQAPPVQPGTGGVPRGQSTPDDQLTLTDPDTVAATFVSRLLEVDTDFDNRPSDANPRAIPLAASPLTQTLTEQPQGQIPGWFSDLKQRGGWTGVTTTLGGLGQQPPDTPTEAYRAVTARTTPLAEGWQGEPQTTTWVITLTATNTEWRVTAFDLIS